MVKATRSPMGEKEDSCGFLGCTMYFLFSYPINWALMKFITIPYMIESGEELSQVRITILFVGSPIFLPLQVFLIIGKGIANLGCNLTEVLF